MPFDTDQPLTLRAIPTTINLTNPYPVGGPSGGSREGPSGPFDETLCNCYGALRLALVRKHYGLLTVETGETKKDALGGLVALREKVMLGELSQADLEALTSLYVSWRDKREVLPMRKTYLKREVLNCNGLPIDADKLASFQYARPGTSYKGYLFRDVETSEWVFKETVKRGNRPYIELVKQKFGVFIGREPKVFFDESWGLKETSMLYITGTVDPSQKGRCDSWLHFGEMWNRFITNLRNQFGPIAYIRTWQSQANGYPHFHALLYFEQRSFTVVEWTHPNGKTSYRLPSRSGDRTKIKKTWKWGNLDIVCVQNTHDAFTDLLKYVTRDLEGGESDLTNAMVWFFGKQSFSFSGDFVKAVWGDGETLASLEPSDADLINDERGNSNSKLIRIEVFPIIPAEILPFRWEKGAGPPKLFVHWLENQADMDAFTARTTPEGVQTIVYKRREESRGGEFCNGGIYTGGKGFSQCLDGFDG